MTSTSSFAGENHILKAFDEDTIRRLTPHLERVELSLGEYIFHANTKITHAYFPERSVVSLVATTSKGESSEIAVIGREGLVGWQITMGTSYSPYECMIQIADGGYKLPARVLLEEFRRSDTAHDIVLAFVNKLMVQMSQTTLCNGRHTVEERLCRWLLMSHDRVDGDEIGLTHEFLSVMLGVTRVSVTIAARSLQAIGHISYTRGKITITDRKGLVEGSCECYTIVQREYDRPFGDRNTADRN
jgi:CRP-like cAMP-binding protein